MVRFGSLWRFSAFLVALHVSAVLSSSDLCLNGSCTLELKSRNSSIGGLISLSGSSTSIADLSPSSGWKILSCSSSTSAQTIRIVCTGEDADCRHIFDNGAENTIVRLPPECGKGPLAVVESIVASYDQSVPSDVPKRVRTRRSGLTTLAQVQDLSIHSDFSRIKPSQHGNVSFAIVGTSILNALSNMKITPDIDVQDIVKVLKNTAEGSPGTSTIELPLTSMDLSPGLISGGFNCPGGFEATIFCSAQFQMTLSASLGVIATGNLSPLDLSTFATITDFSMDYEAGFHLQSNVFGTLSFGTSAAVQTIDIPTLNFFIDGIIDVTPSIQLSLAPSSFDLDSFVSYNLSYPVSMPNSQLVFPSSAGESEVTITPGPGNIVLASAPDVSMDTSFGLGLIPSIVLDVNGFDLPPTTITLAFVNTVSTILDFIPSGNPSSFSGCDEIDNALGITAQASNSFGSTLPTNEETLFEDTFNTRLNCVGASAKRSEVTNGQPKKFRKIKRGFSCLSTDQSASSMPVDVDSSFPL